MHAVDEVANVEAGPSVLESLSFLSVTLPLYKVVYRL